MWQLIRNTTFHTITPAVAVAMGTRFWDCMALIVWEVHFAWAHEAEGWFGGIHVCTCGAITSARTVKTFLWSLDSLLSVITAALRQYSLYHYSSEPLIVPLEGICAVPLAGLVSSFNILKLKKLWKQNLERPAHISSLITFLRSALTLPWWEAKQTQEFKCRRQAWCCCHAFLPTSPAE